MPVRKMSPDKKAGLVYFNQTGIGRDHVPVGERGQSLSGGIFVVTEHCKGLYDEVVVGFLWQAGHGYGCHQPCSLYVYRERTPVGRIANLIEPRIVFHCPSAVPCPEAYQERRRGESLCCPALLVDPDFIVRRRSGEGDMKQNVLVSTDIDG
jgi:hypothetical protein